jgi:hypothetical protein
MEFENNRPVSDEERRLAEAKKLTLQPVHSDIVPDAPQDAEIATRHLLEPAIANVASDTEESTTRVMPTKSLLNTQQSAKPQTYKLVIGLTVGTVLFAGMAAFAFLK